MSKRLIVKSFDQVSLTIFNNKYWVYCRHCRLLISCNSQKEIKLFFFFYPRFPSNITSSWTIITHFLYFDMTMLLYNCSPQRKLTKTGFFCLLLTALLLLYLINKIIHKLVSQDSPVSVTFSDCHDHKTSTWYTSNCQTDITGIAK